MTALTAILLSIVASLTLSNRPLQGGAPMNIPPPDPLKATASDIVVGPESDTLFVFSDYELAGNLFVVGNGVVIVEGAELTLHGVLYQADHSCFLVRNDGYLHVMQQFVSQYPHYMYDHARFEATDAKVYANMVYRSFLNDSSTYVAERTEFPFWNFREAYDRSTLIIRDADMVGDFLVRDSCYVEMTRCDTVLPWFAVDTGETLDVMFPDPEFVAHYRLDAGIPGISGVGYRAVFDSCHALIGGIDAIGGCAVARNSAFCLALRLTDVGDYRIDDLNNQTGYLWRHLTFGDCSVSVINSYLQLWCFYTYGNSVVSVESSFWGESHAEDDSRIYASGCSSNGFPSSVTSMHDGYFEFRDGTVTAWVSSWHNSTNYLEDTVVTPTRPGLAQKSNIAHQSSRMLCVNCRFDSLPFALDSALVMYAAIDMPDTVSAVDSLAIIGSAWADVGPLSSDSFASYSLRYRVAGDSMWTTAEDSAAPIHHGTLGIIGVESLPEGEYEIVLTVFTSMGESLVAEADISNRWAVAAGVPPHPLIPALTAFPNPFDTEVAFVVSGVDPGDVAFSLRVYDPAGRLVCALPWDDAERMGTGTVVTWRPPGTLPSGPYYVRVATEGAASGHRIVRVH